MGLGAALFGSFFFFNDTATTEIYTLSLHDALPIYDISILQAEFSTTQVLDRPVHGRLFFEQDRKSTRLNSSHQIISYAVFCLKKKITRISSVIGSATPPTTRTRRRPNTCVSRVPRP